MQDPNALPKKPRELKRHELLAIGTIFQLHEGPENTAFIVKKDGSYAYCVHDQFPAWTNVPLSITPSTEVIVLTVEEIAEHNKHDLHVAPSNLLNYIGYALIAIPVLGGVCYVILLLTGIVQPN